MPTNDIGGQSNGYMSGGTTTVSPSINSSPIFNLKESLKSLQSSIAQNNVDITNAKQKEREQNVINFNQASKTVKSEDLRKRYGIASRGEMLGMMLTGSQPGYENLTTKEAVSRYREEHQGAGQQMFDFTHGDEDPIEWGIKMGFVKSDEQEEDERTEGVLSSIGNRMGDVYNSFISASHEMGGGLANLTASIPFMPDSVKENVALNNYLNDNFGVLSNKATPEQIMEARNAIKQTEDYDARLSRGALDTTVGGVDAVITAAAPFTKLLFSTAGNTPVTREILGGFGELLTFGGSIINKAPLLSDFRDSLGSEAEKEKLDSFVGNMGFVEYMKNRSSIKGGIKNLKNQPKSTLGNMVDSAVDSTKNFLSNPKGSIQGAWGNIKNTVSNDIDMLQKGDQYLLSKAKDPVGTAKSIYNFANENAGKIIDYFKKNLAERNEKNAIKTEQNIEDVAGKIAKPKDTREAPQSVRGLKEVDIDGVKDYKELQNRFDLAEERLLKQEDLEYAKDERKFKPNETQTNFTLEKDGYSSSKERNPVQKGIDLLKDFYEGNELKSAEIDIIEQKFNNEGLTKREINNISKAISSEHTSYKDRGQPKASIEAKDVESIREGVKGFAREGNPALEEFDRKINDVKNTKAMIKDIRNEIVKTKANKKNLTMAQKIGGAAGALFNATGILNFFSKILSKKLVEGAENYTPLTREQQLSANLKLFKELNEKMSGKNGSTSLVPRDIEEFNQKFEEINGPLEGEVIDPNIKQDWAEYTGKPTNGFDEVVESQNSEYKRYTQDKPQLGENEFYNGQDPLDYTSPTRVTPEGYAGRPGQIIEGFKNPKVKEAAINKPIQGSRATMLQASLDSLAKEIIDGGGITFDMGKSINYGGKPYVSVSPFPNRSEIVPIKNFNGDTLGNYVIKNQDLLFQDGFVLGGWANEGNMYLDVSVALPKSLQSEAINLANKYNQKAIFNLENFEEIPTNGNGEYIPVNEPELIQYLQSLLSNK